MALYRNIAGIPKNNSIGLSLLPPPIFAPPVAPISTVPGFPIPGSQDTRDNFQESYRAEMIAKYDWLISHSIEAINAVPYFVSKDGSIFKGTPESGTAYLGLDWIQEIENERGTAGALLYHMGQAELAKNTAGFQGGSSGTWYEEGGVDPNTQIVSDPIIEVIALPPVAPTSDGGLEFTEPPGELPPLSPGSTTPTTTTTKPINNILPLALLAGLTVVAIAGDELLKKRRKIVFLGGVGALFYLMAKK
jgi:hypothetical protein